MRAAPNDAEALNTAGALDRRQGRWEEALANLTRARELDPRNLSVFSNLLETFLALHRYPEADRAIGDALKVSPRAYFFTLARGALPLYQSGEIAPLRSTLAKIPAELEPGGAVTTITLRV